MDEAVGQHRLSWQTARIDALQALTPRVMRVVLRPDRWVRPRPGQHLDVRLTAEDGYQAQRSCSLLSPPQRTGLYELGIERLDDGEVSTWFHDKAQHGETIEVLGPVGGHFVLDESNTRPALLIGGGSGVVPLLSMAAQRVGAYSLAHTTLLIAARHLEEVLLWPTLQRWEAFTPRFRTRLALSRDTCAPRVQDHVGRIVEADVAWALQQVGNVATESAQVFICGRNDFVESIVHMVTGLNVPEVSIRTERFGS